MKCAKIWGAKLLVHIKAYRSVTFCTLPIDDLKDTEEGVKNNENHH